MFIMKSLNPVIQYHAAVSSAVLYSLIFLLSNFFSFCQVQLSHFTLILYFMKSYFNILSSYTFSFYSAISLFYPEISSYYVNSSQYNCHIIFLSHNLIPWSYVSQNANIPSHIKTHAIPACHTTRNLLSRECRAHHNTHTLSTITATEEAPSAVLQESHNSRRGLHLTTGHWADRVTPPTTTTLPHQFNTLQ